MYRIWNCVCFVYSDCLFVSFIDSYITFLLFCHGCENGDRTNNSYFDASNPKSDLHMTSSWSSWSNKQAHSILLNSSSGFVCTILIFPFYFLLLPTPEYVIIYIMISPKYSRAPSPRPDLVVTTPHNFDDFEIMALMILPGCSILSLLPVKVVLATCPLYNISLT